jgi:hypothetical protein
MSNLCGIYVCEKTTARRKNSKGVYSFTQQTPEGNIVDASLVMYRVGMYRVVYRVGKNVATD